MGTARKPTSPADNRRFRTPLKYAEWTIDKFTCGGGSALFECGSGENNFCASRNANTDDIEDEISYVRSESILKKMAENRSQEDTQTSGQSLLSRTGFLAKGFAADAGHAIGSFGSAAFQSITTRKYTLPDKSVASQVLMYRQLLHTKCRPGLKLSRPYQATAAQKAVMHMPWWEEGIEQTEKMTISYDNLVTRLWLNGAIIPFQGQDGGDNVDTMLDEEGLPPIPHQYWVDRLGFQQPDPVTDFRSGGVLSLAMMVHMVESCPQICERLFSGDASVLPFGLTCINVTDMIAKFLMLAKSTDRMDALLSQKPFWKMFADPNAITAVQELAMTMLCDVVVEVSQERKVPSLARQHSTSMHGDSSSEVSNGQQNYCYCQRDIISHCSFDEGLCV